MRVESLAREAQDIESEREQRFIMCWTTDISDYMRKHPEYGQNGLKSELVTSEQGLERMLGYDWCGLYPTRRKCMELGGRFFLSVQVLEPYYGSDDEPFPIIANPSVTAFKHRDLSREQEIRVEGFVDREDSDEQEEVVKTEFVSWAIHDFRRLSLRVGADAEAKEMNEIEDLCRELGIRLLGQSLLGDAEAEESAGKQSDPCQDRGRGRK